MSVSDRTNPRILVALATYNERENLPDIVAAIQAAVPHGDLLVVDDDSPDGSGKWCEARAKQDERFHCLIRRAERGLGSATIAGFQYALEHDYDLVVNLDADFSHDPAEISHLVQPVQTGAADVAVASRYVNGGAIEGWPLRRRIISRVVNWIARMALRLPVRDCSGSYRCYSAQKLRELELSRIESTGYSFFEEILWHLRLAGATFVEHPITFRERRHGVTKADWLVSLKSGSRLLWIALRAVFCR